MDGRNCGPKVWLAYNQKALDRQYDESSLVPNANEYIARNARNRVEVRSCLNCPLNVPNSPSTDETLNMFPTADNTPVVIYITDGALAR